MSGEIQPIKKITRNVKLLALQRAERVLLHPEDYSADLYNETYLTVLKNAVPRTQEITGEDGEAIKLVFDKTFNVTSDSSSEAAGDNKIEGQV